MLIGFWRFAMQNKFAPRMARWHDYVSHVHAPAGLCHWLTERGSLTAKLIAHSDQFRVQRVFQHPDFCWADEYQKIGLPKAAKVHAREVLLRCDDTPVVYAHTVLPLQSTASQWPLFRTLGNKSLGSTLFGDPQVVRGAMQYARLQPNHPAMRRAQELCSDAFGSASVESGDTAQAGHRFSQPLFARRSLFYRRGGVMLVTELFLPTIEQLNLKST